MAKQLMYTLGLLLVNIQLSYGEAPLKPGGASGSGWPTSCIPSLDGSRGTGESGGSGGSGSECELGSSQQQSIPSTVTDTILQSASEAAGLPSKTTAVISSSMVLFEPPSSGVAEDDSSTGLVIGITIGVVVLVVITVIVVLLMIFIVVRRRKYSVTEITTTEKRRKILEKRSDSFVLHQMNKRAFVDR